MDNLQIYNAVRMVPPEAQKEIKGGRLNGKTDINPMWRIKVLTEQFGPCGIGWKYDITKQWMEPGANGEISAFCNVLLYYKAGDQWSDGIPGTGGSAFVAKEKSCLYTSDECYKMALTDALSVACKAIGVAADVYWQKDATKYTGRPEAPNPQYIDEIKQTVLMKESHRTGQTLPQMLAFIGKKFPEDAPNTIGHITEKQFAYIVKVFEKMPDKVEPHEAAV